MTPTSPWQAPSSRCCVKLKRRSAKAAPADKAAQVAKVFAEVHSKYFAGDYAAANAGLNSIWHLMGGAD